MPQTDPKPASQHAPFSTLLASVWYAEDLPYIKYNIKQIIREVDPVTGLTALHIAIGRNDLSLTKLLVQAGAAFCPDKQGRMPSTIAALMEVNDELLDYVAEMEERK
jgi:ankyrin repeat protein